jgi:hypothetical protein
MKQLFYLATPPINEPFAAYGADYLIADCRFTIHDDLRTTNTT